MFTGEWLWLLVYPVVALALSFAGALKWLGGLYVSFLVVPDRPGVLILRCYMDENESKDPQSIKSI